MDSSAIALQGLQQAEVQVETAAVRIARAGTADGTNLDVVELSAEMVALMSAQASFSANLATLKTADQMLHSLVDLRA